MIFSQQQSEVQSEDLSFIGISLGDILYFSSEKDMKVPNPTIKWSYWLVLSA